MHIQEQEERDFQVATTQEMARLQALLEGMANVDQEWVSTSWDTWEKNPCYNGTPGRHPEDDYYDD